MITKADDIAKIIHNASQDFSSKNIAAATVPGWQWSFMALDLDSRSSMILLFPQHVLKDVTTNGHSLVFFLSASKSQVPLINETWT